MIDGQAVRTRYEALLGCLDERGRRLFAAVETRTAGYGGIAAVARGTGIAPSTIDRGLKDLAASVCLDGSVRRAGSGRQPLTTADPTLQEDLWGIEIVDFVRRVYNPGLVPEVVEVRQDERLPDGQAVVEGTIAPR